MAKLTYHGHAAFLLELDDGTRISIDPWYEESPANDLSLADLGKIDYVLCTHGHFDHFADAVPLAKATGATLVSTFEIVAFAQTQGVENAHPMHIGGGYDFPFGRVKMTPALHGGQVHGDETGAYTTVPGGLLVHADGTRIYHAGDTALLTDMKLLRGQVDVALLPIGDNFTMGPADAAVAVDFVQPTVVVPIHYATAPPEPGTPAESLPSIVQDPEAFRALVGNAARVEAMAAGDALDLGG